MRNAHPLRALLLTPPYLTLFALLSLLAGALEGRVPMVLVAGAGTLAALGSWLRRAWRRRRDRRRGVIEIDTRAPTDTRTERGVRHAVAVGIVCAAAYAEWVALELALHPWHDPPPGPVHGEIHAHGLDFDKGGTYWSPDLCRPAINPGVTAVALMAHDEPFPVAWVIARPGGEVAAIDIQRTPYTPTIRFLPAECTRLHGEVRPAAPPAPPPTSGSLPAPGQATTGVGGLAGFTDAECEHASDTLTLHVDFAGCAAP